MFVERWLILLTFLGFLMKIPGEAGRSYPSQKNKGNSTVVLPKPMKKNPYYFQSACS